MKHTPPRPSKSKRRSKARFILPIVGFGLLFAVSLLVMRSMKVNYSESEILRSIHATALRQSESPGVPNGGPLGPWWISASEADPYSGVFLDFSITTETMIIAAKKARVEIDPIKDTFVIDMEGVVMTYFGSSEQAEDQPLVEMSRYRLGPAPIGVDIRADAGHAQPYETPLANDVSPLAGVQLPDH